MEEFVSKTLLRLRKGDVEALRTVYMMYASKVRDTALRLLGSATDAEDVTQDVFLKLWEFRQNLDRVESLENYLFRMTKNAVLDAFRHRTVKLRYINDSQVHTPPRAGQEDDSTLQLLHMIDREVAKMPEQRRMCFHLSRYEKMSYNEIAELLDISPKTVQYHIGRALADLRALLADDLKD